MQLEKILHFLEGLKNNNHKEWMDQHRSEYHECKGIFEELVNFLIMEIQQFDPSVVGVTPKQSIFRLNRDIRFSKDKSPYKTNFGAFISEDGKKSFKPGYYLHMQPGNESFLAGGIYMPPGDILKKIRQEVDYNPTELKKIVSETSFKETFGEIQGEKLKTAPQGYSTDHPNIEFLKLKSYIVMHKLSDRQIKTPDFPQKVVEVFKVLRPFNEYLGVAIS